jgi:hypothetical protein
MEVNKVKNILISLQIFGLASHTLTDLYFGKQFIGISPSFDFLLGIAPNLIASLFIFPTFFSYLLIENQNKLSFNKIPLT